MHNQTWLSLWAAFASGPDWNTETNLALQMTDEWRDRVLAATRVSTKSILDILGAAHEPCFFAFGRHTANDFLHTVGIFPGAPAIFICRNGTRYTLFKLGIVSYMKTWVSHKFLDFAGGIPNTLNPFAYNYKSFVVNLMHLLVFRRSHTFVPRQLFNVMLRAGLFNPRHVIGMCRYHILNFALIPSNTGQRYTLSIDDRPCTKKSRRVQVYFRSGLKCYTCIRAIAPKGWKDGVQVSASVEAQCETTFAYYTFLIVVGGRFEICRLRHYHRMRRVP